MAKKKAKKRSAVLPIILLIAVITASLYFFGLLPTDTPTPPTESTATVTTADSTAPQETLPSETTSSESTSSPAAGTPADPAPGGIADAATIKSADLSIHFLELGNKYTGDCTYIKVGDVDILIDAGSRVGSIGTITDYLDRYVTDGTLEYVIVTHAHQDHYAGFATGKTTKSIFDLYECETIIDFAKTNQKSDAQMYSNYIRERDDEIAAGATHYTAAECMTSGKNLFSLSDSVTLEILDSYYYYNDSSDENNYSVCLMISDGDRNYLFTGDLEEEGESHLVDLNELPEVELFKAGHHGSPTSSTDKLLSVIKPKHVAVCCCCGSPEYTDTPANQFPSQAFINRIAPYTKSVYITTLSVDYKNAVFTSMNGNIVFIIKGDDLSISCSGSTLPLHKSDWFRENRTCPPAWKDAA